MSGPSEFVAYRSEGPIIYMEPVRSVLYITPQLMIHHTMAIPSWWRRMWYWLLLGWKWKAV